MTLRARIALALAALAGLAALLVAVTTYLATDQRVRAEVDRSLSAQAALLRGPDRGAINALCGLGPQAGPRGRRPGEGFERLSGVVTQCLDAQGRPASSFTTVGLPVDGTDRRLASAGGPTRTRTVSVDGVAYRVETVPIDGAAIGAVQIARDFSESQRVLRALRWWLVAIVVSVTGLGALAGWLIARRATQPLVALTDAAEEVASTGRLDVDVPPAGNDESGRLARAFATMLAALSQSRGQQQQLVQDAGHELRTPLTSLRTNVDILRRHAELPDATRAAILSDLESESRELGSLVDELVQLASDTHADEAEQPVALDHLVERLGERARRRTGRAVTVAAEPTMVTGRPRDLARAVGNLIDNATKFSPAPAPVEVTVSHGTVVVRDHGPGIDDADRTQVFQRFYRAPSARSQPGSGLGLAIVEQTALAHGGTVSVSNHPAGGAVFTLRLPEAVPVPPHHPSPGPSLPPAAPAPLSPTTASEVLRPGDDASSP